MRGFHRPSPWRRRAIPEQMLPAIFMLIFFVVATMRAQRPDATENATPISLIADGSFEQFAHADDTEAEDRRQAWQISTFTGSRIPRSQLAAEGRLGGSALELHGGSDGTRLWQCIDVSGHAGRLLRLRFRVRMPERGSRKAGYLICTAVEFGRAGSCAPTSPYRLRGVKEVLYDGRDSIAPAWTLVERVFALDPRARSLRLEIDAVRGTTSDASASFRIDDVELMPYAAADDQRTPAALDSLPISSTHPQATVAVLPFRIGDTTSVPAWVAAGLADRISEAMGNIPNVVRLPREYIARVIAANGIRSGDLGRNGAAAERVRFLLGATVLVAGQIELRHDSLVVLTSTHGGAWFTAGADSLGAASQAYGTPDSVDLNTLGTSLAARVVARPAVAWVEAPTADVAAEGYEARSYTLFVRGRLLIHSSERGKIQQGVELMERVARSAPSYLPARQEAAIGRARIGSILNAPENPIEHEATLAILRGELARSFLGARDSLRARLALSGAFDDDATTLHAMVEGVLETPELELLLATARNRPPGSDDFVFKLLSAKFGAPTSYPLGQCQVPARTIAHSLALQRIACIDPPLACSDRSALLTGEIKRFYGRTNNRVIQVHLLISIRSMDAGGKSGATRRARSGYELLVSVAGKEGRRGDSSTIPLSDEGRDACLKMVEEMVTSIREACTTNGSERQ